MGGGFHELKTGGHLSVHADFNKHPSMTVERRVSVLIYLNEGWTEADGGQLELWANDMSRCVESIVPVFNRMVAFNTTSHSNHGNPNLVAEPTGTATWSEDHARHTTLFHVRPGTADEAAFETNDTVRDPRQVIKDFIPPVALRTFKGVREARRMGRS